jgi:hypothetical protein
MSFRFFNVLLRMLLQGTLVVLTLNLELLAESELHVRPAGREVEVTWSGGALQTAPELSGVWTTMVDASSPRRFPLAGRAFYRVQETYLLSVTRAGTGSGSVRSAAGIDCGTDCGEVLLSGRVVTVQAVPDQGTSFAGWSGDCTGMGDCQVAMDRAKSVTATFSRNGSVNTVINGGFEEGPLSGWQQQPGQVIYTGAQLGVAPHSGQYLARLGYEQDSRRLARIGQQITLPNTKPLFLNFALWLYSEELCDVPYYDSISIYIAGERVVAEDRVCQGSGTGGWRRYSIGLDAAAGQSVAVVFEISSADALTSIMLLDDISVSNESWQ